ncbi:MAG: N-formylglutamate amidohydrolase [Proteobacteria bacterium]|nr:MAG: N-formylglutamate amidohydrolase [Pseudomonadota bacterium]
MLAPFEIWRPRAEAETPLVVEIPHAGLFVPADCLALLDVPARSLAEDADLHVDVLYARAAELGASAIVCTLSRYVVDMNRSELDIDGLAVTGRRSQHAAVRGVVWRESGRGERVLRRPLSEDEFVARLRLWHRPYHEAFAALVAEKKRKFGFAVVLAAHSMPSRTDRLGAVADVVPGSRGRTSAAPAVLEAVENVTAEHGYSLRHDAPYRGGYTTGHYGKPREGVHVIQIELARRLYMDEATLQLAPDLTAIRAYCDALVVRLGALPTGTV